MYVFTLWNLINYGRIPTTGRSIIILDRLIFIHSTLVAVNKTGYNHKNIPKSICGTCMHATNSTWCSVLRSSLHLIFCLCLEVQRESLLCEVFFLTLLGVTYRVVCIPINLMSYSLNSFDTKNSLVCLILFSYNSCLRLLDDFIQRLFIYWCQNPMMQFSFSSKSKLFWVFFFYSS